MILTAGRVIEKIKRENKNKVVNYICSIYQFATQTFSGGYKRKIYTDKRWTGMLSLIGKKIFPQRLKHQTYIKHGIFKRIYRWTAKLLNNLLSNYWYISKFGRWSCFNMLVLGSQYFYFISRVIYVTDSFSPSELIC